jgi:pyrophosphatase PpaX
LESTFGEVCGDRAEVEAMIQTYREHNLAHHDARVRPYPGARHAVQSLAAAGCRLALVTSKRRVGALRGLRVLGLEAEFHVVVGADDCVRHKPDPEPVHVALRAMSVGADEAVFIGDSTHDLVAGRAAGVRTAAALWGPFPVADLLACEPDHAFRSFAELLSTLRSA